MFFREMRVSKGKSKVLIREKTVDLSAGGFGDEVKLSTPTLTASAYAKGRGISTLFGKLFLLISNLRKQKEFLGAWLAKESSQKGEGLGGGWGCGNDKAGKQATSTSTTTTIYK